jgi:imidazolonepropionase-like amidohydrolase
MDDYDPTREYVLMSSAGLRFPQILASLTTSPAERFGLSEHSGRVAVGMDADLVLLAHDPALDATAFSAVRSAFRKGQLVYQAK